MRLSVTGTTLYASVETVTFVVRGTRFRTLGKLQDTFTLNLDNKDVNTRK
jgi:hypothetical protein